MSKRKHFEEVEKEQTTKTVVHEDESSGKSYPQKFFGPYISERQWCTVREEYLGNCWDQVTYDVIAPRSYHWGEDGLFGLSDEKQKLCIGFNLWNGKDPVMKERLFGLTGPQGNHGEDVKELYFYLYNLPDHRYMRGLYFYPQSEFPYEELRQKNRARNVGEPEYEILDTDVFTEGYWHIDIEFGKPENGTILCRYTVTNKGQVPCTLELSPKFWFRKCENDWKRRIQMKDSSTIIIEYDLGDFIVRFFKSERNAVPELSFSDADKNESKSCMATYKLQVNPGQQDTIEWKLSPSTCSVDPDVLYCTKETLRQLKQQADLFYESLCSDRWSEEEKLVAKGAWAGLLWNKQFYYYDVEEWYNRGQAIDSESKDMSGNWDVHGRNRNWKQHFKAHDILAVPDKWEFPWFAPWDTCFQMIPFCRLDAEFAKSQLLLLLSDRYMSPEGKIPGCEFNFDDNNPPIHAWACLKVFRMTGEKDSYFLSRAYNRLQKNYSWWMSNIQCTDRWTFSGGFLGLDNISVIDRGCPPTGYTIKQADGTAWMALYALGMFEIADILWSENMMETAVNDMVQYLKDFLHIAEQLNKEISDGGFWNSKMNFYNDVLVEKSTQKHYPIEVKSLVGLLPLVSCCKFKSGCKGRFDLQFILDTKSRFIVKCSDEDSYFLTCVPGDRIQCLTDVLFDEQEFLSKFGIRSISKAHSDPYTLALPVLAKIKVNKSIPEQQLIVKSTNILSVKPTSVKRTTTKSDSMSSSSCPDSQLEVKQAESASTKKEDKQKDISYTCTSVRGDNSKTCIKGGNFTKNVRGGNLREEIVMTNFSLSYAPGESDSKMFGGNSNWRGPVWMCANYILLDALEQISSCFGDKVSVKRTDIKKTIKIPLSQATKDVCKRLVSIFLTDSTGSRPLHGHYEQFKEESWKDLILYYEYFHPDTGKGCGASHQTGWTSLISEILHKLYS